MLRKFWNWVKKDEENWTRSAGNRFNSAPVFAFLALVWLALEGSNGNFASYFIAAGFVTGMVWGLMLSIYWKTKNLLVGGLLLFCILEGMRKAPEWLLQIKLDNMSWTQNNQFMASSVFTAMALAYWLRPRASRSNQIKNEIPIE
jgi:hypothetical protein